MTAGSDGAGPRGGRGAPGARAAIAFVFLLAAALVVRWGFAMPGGFPVGHPRWWINRAFPAAAIPLLILVRILARRRGDESLKTAAYCFAAFVVSGVIAGKTLYPLSVSGKLLLLLCGGAGFSLWLASIPRRAFGCRVLPGRSGAALMLLAAACGAFVPWSWRAPAPRTRPLNLQMPDVAADPDAGPPYYPRDPVSGFSLDGGIYIDPLAVRVNVRVDEIGISMHPLLTFESRSPDRFWSVFAPHSTGREKRRHLTGLNRGGGDATLEYADDDRSVLRIRVPTSDADDGPVEIESWSALPAPVFSHLNTFTEMDFRGGSGYALRFSACDGEFEFRPSDYPTGRPARFAWLDENNVLRVVEASTGEKGPFTTLGEGLLDPDAPLDLTLLVGGEERCTIRLHDWAAQAGRGLSPTAGWGVAENAIEFRLAEDFIESRAVIFITLAATSVGRGWDTVGHAAGVYRNRIEVFR